MPPFRRVWSRAARLAVERLPTDGRVLALGPQAPRLAAALNERGLEAWAAESPLRADGLFRVTESGEAAPWTMIALCLALSDKNDQDRRALLEAAQSEAPLALFVDWQRAERNLELPAVGLRRAAFRVFASSGRRSAVAAYDAAGGLEGVLYLLREQGRVVARASCLGGCLGLALVAWNRPRRQDGSKA